MRLLYTLALFAFHWGSPKFQTVTNQTICCTIASEATTWEGNLVFNMPLSASYCGSNVVTTMTPGNVLLLNIIDM